MLHRPALSARRATTTCKLLATAGLLAVSGREAVCQDEDNNGSDMLNSASTQEQQVRAKPGDLDFWQNVWTKSTQEHHNPFWHFDFVNPNLKLFKDQFFGEHKSSQTRRFFVPLCGKSVDLIWLAQYGFVAGVDIAQEAIDQFRDEHDLSWSVYALEKSANTLFHAKVPGTAHDVVIAKKDLFNLPQGWSEPNTKVTQNVKFNYIWDRASLVAIEPKMRRAYVASLVEQCTPDAVVLLCTFEYPTEVRKPPPHSISEDTVHELFTEFFEIQLLDRHEVPMRSTKEAVYLLRRKQTGTSSL